jgi:hypothetical protein
VTSNPGDVDVDPQILDPVEMMMAFVLNRRFRVISPMTYEQGVQEGEGVV